MKCELRFAATAVAISTLSLTSVSASASALDDNPAALAALHVKAKSAQPRDRCFLYTARQPHDGLRSQPPCDSRDLLTI